MKGRGNMKKYDVCLYYLGEEVGGFHIEGSKTIDELVEFINEEYEDIEFDRISIIEL